MSHYRFLLTSAAAAAVLAVSAPSSAAVKVTVHVQNLAPTHSVAVGALSVAFNSGAYDPFNGGQAASAAVVRVAELGSGALWQPAFAAGDPGAVIGQTPGPLTPGKAGSVSFLVDPTVNPYFSFAAMVVPSNDFFIGNDSPTRFRLFDSFGHLAIQSITEKASDVWNAGSEIFDPLAAAFLQVGNATLRTPENGVIDKAADFTGYNGFVTGAGYVFDAALTPDTNIYRISFSTEAVPEPATWAMMIGGLGAVGLMLRRRRAAVAFCADPA